MQRRRTYLKLLGFGTIGGIAGCVDGSGDDSDDTTEPTPDTDSADDTPDEDSSDDETDDTDSESEESEYSRDGAQLTWEMAYQSPENNTALDTWGPVEKPSVDWSFETDHSVSAAPIVTDDMVYLVAGDGYEGVAYAIDRETSEQEWEYKTGGVQYSTPLLDDGTLYFGGRRFDEGGIPPVEFDGMLYALDAETGEEEWLVEEMADDIIDTPPTIVDGVVIVASDDGRVYAVDAETGEKEWEHRVRGELRGSPAVADGSVYVGTADNRGDGVYAIDIESGEREWETEVNDFIQNSPVVADDTVFIADHHQTYALEPADGEERWSYRYDGIDVTPPTDATPAVRDGVVYTSSGGAIAAVDVESGEELWGEAVSSAGSGIPGGPVITEDILYAADQSLYALDLETGEELWEFEEESVRTEPVVMNGDIYIGGRNGVYRLSE